MTKLKNPLLSLDARGRLAKLFALTKRRGQNIIEQKPIPPDAKSPAQLFNRHMYSKCVTLWNLLSKEEKQQWRSLARPKHMPGQAWFISQCLRPNPGIYLPLQGGTMKGNIDMGSFRLLNLIDPVLDQEPVTKKYFEDNVPPGAGDMLKADYDPNDDKVIALAQLDPLTCSEAEADGKILAHKGDASAHHTRYTNAEAIAAAATRESYAYALPIAGKEAKVNPQGVSVAAAGDGCFMRLLVPQDFIAITAIEVIFISNENAASMYFEIHTYYGVYTGGEAYNVHTETVNDRNIGAVVNNQYKNHSISDLVDVAPLAKGDILIVRVLYRATAIDSNAVVSGLRLKYS